MRGGGFGTERGTEWESEEGTLISNSAVAVQVLGVGIGELMPKKVLLPPTALSLSLSLDHPKVERKVNQRREKLQCHA